MGRTVKVNFRIDADLKRQVDELGRKLHMSFSALMNVYAAQLVREQRIPFEITARPRETGPENTSESSPVFRVDACRSASVPGSAGSVPPSSAASPDFPMTAPFDTDDGAEDELVGDGVTASQLRSWMQIPGSADHAPDPEV